MGREAWSHSALAAFAASPSYSQGRAGTNAGWRARPPCREAGSGSKEQAGLGISASRPSLPPARLIGWGRFESRLQAKLMWSEAHGTLTVAVTSKLSHSLPNLRLS